MADVIYAISAGAKHDERSPWQKFDGGFDAFKKKQAFLVGGIPEDSPPVTKKAEEVRTETGQAIDGSEDWILYPQVNFKKDCTLRFYIRQSQLTK